MKKRTVSVVELRALQTFTYAMGLALGFGVITNWLSVVIAAVVFGLVMWIFTALER